MSRVFLPRWTTVAWQCPDCDFRHAMVVTEPIFFDDREDVPPEFELHMITEGHGGRDA